MKYINRNRINIVGAGLAGCEACYYLLKKGYEVHLYEMRPVKMTPAHKGDGFCELVCSNSLRSDSLENAVGILKEELRMLDSILMEAGNKARIPAGGSFAVDRDILSKEVKHILSEFDNLFIHYEEVADFLDGYTIYACGPLVSESLDYKIKEKFGRDNLHFFDAIAPIIDKDGIDFDICYWKNRYDKGDSKDYINCPLTSEQYKEFYDYLVNAPVVATKDFENNIFEGCMPVEVMARRGYETLLFGPLKPVGLNKEDGSRPFAVVQLRIDDIYQKTFNLVGFQTHLTWSAQKELINKYIPGLSKVVINRYGVMHRNTYLNSPKILNNGYQVISDENIFFAGQITGVEGYVESAASGLSAAINLDSFIKNGVINPLPITTIIGSMSNYISHCNNNFVPMNANFGILVDLDFKHKKKERKLLYSNRALTDLKSYIDNYLINK